jgi:hypothetical protein
VGICYCGLASLMRGRFYNLQLLMGVASAVFLGCVVFRPACDSASITLVVSKWRHLQSEKQRKVRGSQVRRVECVGGHRHDVVKTFLMKKEAWDGVLSWCNNQFFVQNVQGEVFANLQAVAANVIAVCGICCLDCRDEFFVSPVAPFSVSMSSGFSIGRIVALSHGQLKYLEVTVLENWALDGQVHSWMLRGVAISHSNAFSARRRLKFS